MSSPALRRLSLIVLVFTLAVIVWGAFVRATGSGAGCGSHWPVCNGEVVPREPSVQTMIEFSHRASSGLSLLLVVALLILTLKQEPKGRPTRALAVAATVFIFLEAAIGAGLVLLELVALSVSARRAVVMSLHLMNTFFLLGALGGHLFHAHNRSGPTRWKGPLAAWLLGAHAAVIVVGMSGGIAALGDTLTQHGVRHAFVDLLVRLRVAHPVLALLSVVLCAVAAAKMWSAAPHARRSVQSLLALLLLQLMVGLLNVTLQAPVAMQLVHLLLADLVWLALHLSSRAALVGVVPQPLPSPEPLAQPS